MSAFPRNRTTTVRQDDIEERLVQYQEEAYKKVENKLDQLILLFQQHIASEGHELLSRRMKTVEDEQIHQSERPLKTWQVVTGVIGLLISLGFILLSIINTAIDVVLFIRVFIH